MRAADVTRAPELPRRPGEAGGQPRPSEAEVRKLIVGREITLSGEITSCDKLMVEGSVEANLTNCRDVDIAESGLFKGSASIEEAEIRGRFEGNLVVRKRLLIKASGRVSGTIRYGQIEIECGGQISGDIQAQPSAEPSEITSTWRAPARRADPRFCGRPRRCDPRAGGRRVSQYCGSATAARAAMISAGPVLAP